MNAAPFQVVPAPRESQVLTREVPRPGLLAERQDVRKTKIICTLGPASGTVERITALARAGMNIARINMSHGDKAAQGELFRKVHLANQGLARPIATLADLKGPEIRTADRTEQVALTAGQLVLITNRSEPSDLFHIGVDYDDIIHDVQEGDAIHVDNGLIQLEVIGKESDALRCRVLAGGMLGSRRHVNLPGVRVRLPPLTAQDRVDINFAADQGVDFIALSFVRSAEAVTEARELLIQLGAPKIQLVSKIENAEGVERFDEILAVSDAVMVARGDLGAEISYCSVPRVQRMIARKCSEAGKPFIVATQILESMMQRPIPTRAEVTDVANAVSEQADAIMLSGETATGDFPVRCVDVLDETAREAEREVGLQLHSTRKPQSLREQLAWGACRLADTSGARAVIVMTRSGELGRLVASNRPNAPVFAFTPDEGALRKLSLSRAIVPFVLHLSPDAESNVAQAFSMLCELGHLRPGDPIVLVSNVAAGQKRICAIQLREIG
jgi:pyruvate kinase